MKCEWDVIVIGAGCAGVLAAKEAVENGLKVAVLEEHSIVGKQNRCAGLVSKTGIGMLGVEYYNAVLNEVTGAKIVVGKTSFYIGGDEVKALVIDRQAFDEECAKEAVGGGALLYLKNRATAFKASRELVEVKASRVFRGRFVVGADGATSLTAKLASFPPMEQMLAYQAEWNGVSVENPCTVQVILDPVFEGFFAWIVPVDEKSARIGFATSNYSFVEQAKRKLYDLPEVRETKLRNGRKAREFYSLIPRGPRTVTQKNRFLLVGDAAGQIKATTGGGIVFSGLCAKIAGECVAEHLQGGKNLEYERRWRTAYGSTLEAHRLLRRFYDALPSTAVKLLAKGIETLRLYKAINRFGDMDFLVRP